MSRILSLQIALQSFLVVHLLTSSTVAVSNSSVGSLETKCTDGERRALLKFKDNLEDTYNYLPSWGNEEEKKNCCSWHGIGCDNRTGHVITLDLRGRDLFMRGELPLSMKKCKELVVMDVGGNELSGPIPTWIGETLGNLVVLIARANNFNGSIPTSLCHLPHLQLLDLSANKISGSIPKCLNNFGAMRSSNTSDISTGIQHVINYVITSDSVEISFGGINYADKIEIMWKGILSEYGNTLRLVKSIDLSNNMLAEQIPAEITDLVALVSFNLSRNSLSGQIPREIGKLKSLDSLDLSNNQLWGQIPPSLALINGLGVLDLSNNNLSGKIPIGPQLQTYNESAYMGNIGLCGAPLLNKCAGEEEPTTPPSSSTTEEDQEDEFITHGFYASLGVGYVVGFWGVLGTLIFNKSWRFAYFKVLNDFANWIYVMVAVRKAKLMRTLHG